MNHTKEFPPWLTSDYIRHLHEKTGILSCYLDAVLSSLEQLQKHPELVQFAINTYDMLRVDGNADEIFKDFRLPEAPDGADTAPYDFIGLFPLLAFYEDVYDSYLKRGISEQMAKETFSDTDGCIRLSEIRVGRPCFTLRYFLWAVRYAKGNMLHIGRLMFEMTTADSLGVSAFRDADGTVRILPNSEQPRPDWTPLMLPGDRVLSIHIPGKGAFTKELCLQTYEQARNIFRTYFPEYKFTGFVCVSWLLSPQLKEILKPQSNILAFADTFTRFPHDEGGYDVFSFVFQKDVTDISKIDLDALPDDTSLMRSVKQWYKDGKFIYEAGGFIPF